MYKYLFNIRSLDFSFLVFTSGKPRGIILQPRVLSKTADPFSSFLLVLLLELKPSSRLLLV